MILYVVMRVARILESKFLLWSFALTVNNWILAIVLNRPLFLKHPSISDFSALTQPYHYIFRFLDVFSGALIILIGLALFSLHKKSVIGKLIALGGVFFGLANIVDALMPLPCTAILDNLCSVPVKLDLSHLVLPNHVYSSVAIGFCILLLPAASWYYAKRLENRGLQLVSLAATAAAILFIIFLSLESFVHSNTIENIAGYMQYAQMIILGWWFIKWGEIYEQDPKAN